MERIGVGIGVLILKYGKVLLGKRVHSQGTFALPGDGSWCMPGGKLDFGESFENCAIREVKEETNLDVDSIKVLGVSNLVEESVHFVTISTMVEHVSGDLKVMEPHKISSWDWFDFDNLPSPLYPATKIVIDHYLQKKFY